MRHEDRDYLLLTREVLRSHREWQQRHELRARPGRRGAPCPSHVDPGRNRHRSGEAWTLRTVVVILGNPRYTGRQVWNRQRADHESQVSDGGTGRAARRLNPSQEWVISKQVAHPALVTERDFVAVQAVRSRC
jgi:site-specific DNA recombinase